jgi:serine/threonine-protein kinase HipA
MTALEAADGAGGDWVDLVDFAQVAGSDTTELWRRAVFGALVGNIDDHLRNHGFLRRRTAWELAPAFDVNPEPLGDHDQHQLALFGDPELDVESFLSKDAVALFSVKPTAATAFVERLRPVVASLPRSAVAHGADPASVDVMNARITAATAALS